MSLTSSRAAALRLLKEVRTRDAWGHEVLAQALPDLQLDDRDTAFATRLVYGVLSAEGTLDEALARYLDRPSRVHPLVRDALRAGAYEILFMGTPDRVAVHQAVEGVRTAQPRAVGLANAVLRRLAEDAPSFPWGDPASDVETLARSTAHPSWLVDLLTNELGCETARSMLEADNEPAPLYLAHNPFLESVEALLTALEKDGVAPREWGPPGCLIAGIPAAAVRSSSLREGACIVADAAAQFVASIAAPAPGRRGVELAAGRGTKTLLMQAASVRSGGPADILSADLHEFKSALLANRMRELGVPGIATVTADTANPDSLDLLGGRASADVVMVDAPCSGLGTLRRHPEKRWRLRPDSIEELAGIGEAMLLNASRLVRPGGFVVYSTCTVTDRENRQVVEGFLKGTAGRGFQTVSLSDHVPAGWERFLTQEGWFLSVPAIGGPDGHFAAVLGAA